MEEKLRRLMKQEGINSTRLAEMLGIQASGISHIMSGRNKPSFDFLLKLLQRFPQINPDWLLLDKGPMYRDEIKKSGTAPANTPAGTQASGSTATGTEPFGRGFSERERQSGQGVGLFAEPGRSYESSQQGHTAERDDEDIIPADSAHDLTGRYHTAISHKNASGAQHNPADTALSHSGAAYNPVLPPSRGFAPSSSIERIVVFYKDKTFSEYQPA